ncbi:MAG: ATP-binding protein [SAR86 cluster bacterium]|uniref:ATP-binding protein n=1 Tax=SAR86 cluster bacterium TaxID=2030880 RepID=A0A2A5AU33_9GAMM|nr:MAG: ATP-binding protein [SAR86 cluster bacterium]
MSTPHKLPPSASSLSESMRDLGYSLATAIADIIDNSITAEATEINVFCDLARDNPTLTIIDNGQGMSDKELLVAMKHGAINPKQERSPLDLGRFGLGLKTASFSQCRNLTVISSNKGALSGAEWDLDFVSEKDEWFLSILDQQEIKEFLYMEQLTSTGTMVVWRKLDRLFEDQSGFKRDEIVNEKLDLVEKHLALVFHRFISGEIKQRKKILIRINGHPVTAFDPFCKKNKATQILPEEIVRVGGNDVVIQPYILPHHSKLTAAEYDFYEDRSSFISNQGVYIYRSGRLMAWGDWFRLVPKGEATKLARVQIDFPNALDENWTIDIKKSRARPPHEVRERLRQVISKITHTSTRVHRGRGQKLFQETSAPIWERYADKGKIRFDLNMSHPILDSLKNGLTDTQFKSLTGYLSAVTSSLPIEMIYSDYSSTPRDVDQVSVEKEVVIQRLKQLKETLFEKNVADLGIFREVMASTRMFDSHKDIVEKFIEEEFDEPKQSTG